MTVNTEEKRWATDEELVELGEIRARGDEIRAARKERHDAEAEQAKIFVAACGGLENLPAGTHIWFKTKAGWYDDHSHVDVIEKVTPKSYVTRNGNRIIREDCGDHYLGRGVKVWRTPVDQMTWDQEDAELSKLAERRNELSNLEWARRNEEANAEREAANLRQRENTRTVRAERKALRDLVELNSDQFAELFADYLADEPLPDEPGFFDYRIISNG